MNGAARTAVKPPHAEPGEYTINYRWRGYYDCIDKGPNNENEVIYDFSDELHDPTSAYSAPALLLSPLSLAVGS